MYPARVVTGGFVLVGDDEELDGEGGATLIEYREDGSVLYQVGGIDGSVCISQWARSSPVAASSGWLQRIWCSTVAGIIRVPGWVMDEPMHSVTTVNHNAVVAAHLMANNTGHQVGEVRQHTHTITTGNQHAAVTSHLVKLRGTC